MLIFLVKLKLTYIYTCVNIGDSTQVNKNLDTLSRAVEGMGPLKPGNLYSYKGAKSHRILILKDEVDITAFSFWKRLFDYLETIFSTILIQDK